MPTALVTKLTDPAIPLAHVVEPVRSIRLFERVEGIGMTSSGVLERGEVVGSLSCIIRSLSLFLGHVIMHTCLLIETRTLLSLSCLNLYCMIANGVAEAGEH